MTTIKDRPNSALIVIDVQGDVVAGAHNLGATVANIKGAVDRARTAGIPVIWVQHNDEEILVDTPGWQIVPELVPAEGEPKVHKSYRSSFEDTTLDQVLQDLKVGHVYLCGMQTNFCVRNTLHAALERGYDVTVLADAHTTTDYDAFGSLVAAETLVNDLNSNVEFYQLPGRAAKTALSTSL
ncbi:MAG: hypothetical protein RL670_810 [Actinomycetota bacterium]